MFKLKNIFLLFVVLFFGCKKYPENELWFKNPQDVFKGGLITEFTISSIDQMPGIRDQYKNFPYNYYGSSIPDVFALPISYNKGSNSINCDYGTGVFKFSANKNEVQIDFKPVNYDAGAQNFFAAGLNWKILKLTDNGQLKIQAVYNYRIYEMQFN
jgi:hypothetical protein